MSDAVDLRALFHRLNNELGVILAHAELLQAKISDDPNRARASQVVQSALAAMTTAREIRQQLPEPSPGPAPEPAPERIGACPR
jgi:hypothetical protein